jgi:hypothetical protein
VETRRIVVHQAERNRQVEQERIGPARAQDRQRLRPIGDHDRRAVRPDLVVDDRGQRRVPGDHPAQTA